MQPFCSLSVTLILVAAASGGVFAGPTTKDARCSQDGLEKCGAELIIFASGPQVATTKAELKETCAKEQTSEKCARDYSNRCLPRLPRGMVTLFLDGVKTEVNGKCKDGHAKNKDYLKYAKCLNDQGDKLHGCMSQLVAVLDQSLSNGTVVVGGKSGKSDSKKQLKESCCSFANMRTCMSEAVKSPCGPEHTKYVDGLINGYAGDLLDTVCSAFNLADCKATAPIKVKANAPKSLLSPLARMVASLQAHG